VQPHIRQGEAVIGQDVAAGDAEFDLVIRGRRVVLPAGERSAAVAVRDGQVAAILRADAAVRAAADLVLSDDEVLMPGLVDTHVHVNEPGRTEWEGFATATLAAAAGGVTTIIDMPLNSEPPTVDAAALEAKRTAARSAGCHVDVGFWGGAVPANLGRLGELFAAGVFGVKCFLADSGVADFPALDEPGLAAALHEVGAHGGRLLVHAEDADVLDQAAAATRRRPPVNATGSALTGIDDLGDRRSYPTFLRSRPAGAEDAAIERLAALAGITGTPVHVVHLSSGSAVGIIADARRDGVQISAETCPHYLALSAEEVPAGATQYKCCPPIRDRANQDAVWGALADGVIDMVVSDHSPCPPALKSFDDGDFGAAWGGIASLELGLPVVWTAARERGHTLAEVAHWMATTPAALAGLPRKGRIGVSADADFCVFSPEKSWAVDVRRLRQRHPITPYAGRRLTGAVRATWLRGEKADGATPRGRLLARTDE
jgi:allantoinase